MRGKNWIPLLSGPCMHMLAGSIHLAAIHIQISQFLRILCCPIHPSSYPIRIRLARFSSPVQAKPSIHLASASALGHYNITLLPWHILLFPGPIVYFHTRLQHPNTTLPPVQDVQGGWGGWPTGNGKKRSSSQACCLAQLCLAVASFLSISCGPSAL